MVFDSLLFPLLENAALLLALVALHELLRDRLTRPPDALAQVLIGLVTGVIAIGLMLLPLRYAPGIIFDTRSVLISLSGLFFGILPTVVAMAVASAYRFWLGGVAAWTGVCVILASGMAGLLWHHFRSRPLESLRWRDLYVFGTCVHVLMLLLMLILPRAIAVDIVARIGLAVMVLFPVLSTLTGMLLVNNLRRRRIAEDLREHNQLLHLSLWAANQALFDIDVERAQITARADKDLEGRDADATLHYTVYEWLDTLHPEDRPQVEEVYRRCAAGELGQFQVELRQRDDDGGWSWMLASGRLHRRPDGERHILGTLIDISMRRQAEDAQKRAEEVIWQQANFDGLTGLPNRNMFQQRLAREIEDGARQDVRTALLFLDLDHFKEVNDTLGHAMGDLLLRQAADRLRRCVREHDLIARLGGDEFVIVLSGLRDGGAASEVANKILRSLARPYELEGETAYMTASIGITIHPDDAATPEDLLKNADQAMYDAKKGGRNRFRYFTPAMQQQVSERMWIATDLRRAIRASELWVAYQPVIRLRDGAVVGAEALMRWRHPQRGDIPPSRFIPVAEDSDLINELGDWVFDAAIADLKRWRERHPRIKLGLNKSPRQFNRPASEGWRARLAAAGVPGDALVVEITEGLLMDAGKGTLEQLLAYPPAGIQVALDDFGTGYCSIAYLNRFRIDFLKIDASYVRNLASGTRDLALCEIMIDMAHRLGMKVVAEGVETETQHDLLLRAGCDLAQGWLYCPPVPAAEFLSYLESGPVVLARDAQG